jgi:hypothetical protein
MSVLSYTDIFPDLLPTDLVIDHQHTPLIICEQDPTLFGDMAKLTDYDTLT